MSRSDKRPEASSSGSAGASGSLGLPVAPPTVNTARCTDPSEVGAPLSGLGSSAEASGAGEKGIEFLADGNGDFAKALGLTMDGSGFGLGTRSQRYSMVVDDGVVTALNVEDTPSKADVSGAENLMKSL
jgi:hypothetical protein